MASPAFICRHMSQAAQSTAVSLISSFTYESKTTHALSTNNRVAYNSENLDAAVCVHLRKQTLNDLFCWQQ